MRRLLTLAVIVTIGIITLAAQSRQPAGTAHTGKAFRFNKVADGVYHVVTFLADAIRTSADGITTAALVARALSTLTEEYRSRAMTALLASPPAARPDTGRLGSAR